MIFRRDPETASISHKSPLDVKRMCSPSGIHTACNPSTGSSSSNGCGASPGVSSQRAPSRENTIRLPSKDQDASWSPTPGSGCVSWVSRRLSSSISQMATDLSEARRENSSLRASGDHGIPPSAPNCDSKSRTGMLVSASRWTRPPNGGTRKIPFRPSRLETNAIQRLSGDQRGLKSPASLSTSGTASPPAVGTTNMDADPGW